MLSQDSNLQRQPYLLISDIENHTFQIRLSNDLMIENRNGILNIGDLQKGENMEINSSKIKSLGFMYLTEESAINLIESEDSKSISLYDLEGMLIRECKDGYPDLTGLKKGEIYIIKKGEKTYKYIPKK